jgi:hypothetical protein
LQQQHIQQPVAAAAQAAAAAAGGHGGHVGMEVDDLSQQLTMHMSIRDAGAHGQHEHEHRHCA